MRNFKSISQSFSDCPFKIMLPQMTETEHFLKFNISISFIGKPHPVKYVIKECRIIDSLGNIIITNPDDCSNFISETKKTVIINERDFIKESFTLVLSVLTVYGEYIEVTYIYKRNMPVVLKSVAIGDMTKEEKDLFVKIYTESKEKTKHTEAAVAPERIKEDQSNQYCLSEFVDAVSSELYFLKNDGGKKHKVTEGQLLTPNSNEYCYSFELESELYLSDDAPIAVMLGSEIVRGAVIVCDGFQMVVSLEKNIGDVVLSAFVCVEPWILLEKLRDKTKSISKNDRIAWKLFHTGPKIADKNNTNISAIKSGQNIAISHAQNEEITVIWGPPGTGKTYTMAQMVKSFVLMGKSVLIVSHSNISVDNVIKQISKLFLEHGLMDFLEQGKVLRYGFVRDEELGKNNQCVAFNFTLNKHKEMKKQYDSFMQESRKLKLELEIKKDIEKAKRRKEIENSLKSIRTMIKAEIQRITGRAQVVATTVSKIYMDSFFENRKYDVVMFDEASMAYVPQLLCAATYAKEKFICVGDFCQLSPIVQSKKAKEVLENDIFAFLNIHRHTEIYNHPWLVMLDEQRRMHPVISKFSNQRIYRGLLKDHESVFSKWDDVITKEPLANQAMNLLELAGSFCAAGKNADNSRFNILSAILSFAIALKSEREQKGLDFKAEEKVGIITPYAAHTRLIRALIQDYRKKEYKSISCATVHQFQGSERNVVIFDAVESYPFTNPGWLVAKNENNSVMRLINVALTRARSKFIAIANTKFWHNKFHESGNMFFYLLEHIKKYNNVVGAKTDSFMRFLHELDFGPNINLLLDENEALDMMIKDINSASYQIIVMMPTDELNPKYEKIIYNILKEKSKSGVSVIGTAKEMTGLNDSWKGLLYKSTNASFPLIAIDGAVTWYGFPLSVLYFEEKNTRFNSIKNPLFRIKGNHTNEMIRSLCDLGYRVDENGFRTKLTEKDNSSAGKGLAKYISETERCKNCRGTMVLIKSRNGKDLLKCSECSAIDFVPVHTINSYLEKVNAKCSVCGKDIYAGVGRYGIYVKCNDGHFTKLLELS